MLSVYYRYYSTCHCLRPTLDHRMFMAVCEFWNHCRHTQGAALMNQMNNTWKYESDCFIFRECYPSWKVCIHQSTVPYNDIFVICQHVLGINIAEYCWHAFRKYTKQSNIKLYFMILNYFIEVISCIFLVLFINIACNELNQYTKYLIHVVQQYNAFPLL